MLEFENEEERIEALKEERIEEFKEESITATKEELLSNLECKLHELESGKDVEEFRNHSVAFRNRYIELVKRFRNKIKNTVLFEKLEPWWSYECEISDRGATLHLQYIESVEPLDNGSFCVFIGEDFELVKVSTRLLTVEEYASIYGVSVGTVRQWIRRGKIRSAVKAGSEWRISELSEITGRGYRGGTFEWNEKLSSIPDEYSFLADYSWLSIDQDETDKTKYSIYMSDREGNEKEIFMDTKEREKFELYLISNPLIHVHEEYFGNFA